MPSSLPKPTPQRPSSRLFGSKWPGRLEADWCAGLLYNAQNEHIGDVSDLYLSKQNQIASVVVQVGGFLGIGGKLVSVPMDKLQLDQSDQIRWSCQTARKTL
jgi:hypothetical protein